MLVFRHRKQNKNMRNKKLKTYPSRHLSKRTTMFASIMIVFSMVVSVPIVRANTIQDQINQLQADNSNKQAQVQSLKVEANGLQATIEALQAQINGIQFQINENSNKSVELERQIVIAQAELDEQKRILGENIKAMYLEGDISTIEMLATSKDLSDYFDKQQYRETVKNKIKDTLDRVTALKTQLTTQQAELKALIEQQTILKSQVAAQKAEQDRLLGLNQEQRSSLDGELKANFNKISELRRQQAIENARLFGSSGPGTGVNCGGGYPGNASGPFGRWGCNFELNYNIDSWGMYNRQCVSYTAFKVAASGRRMPYWGGIGNANQWDENAVNQGIPIDRNPRVGDVAVSNAGEYGHVMYVEAIGDDGSIYVSDYNQQWDGRYREYWLSASRVSAGNLKFIHFQ